MYHQKMINNDFNKDRELEHMIKEIFLNNKEKERYGYRRITLVLKSLGHVVNHKKVLRLMRKIDIKCTKFGNKSRRYNSFRKNAGNQLPYKIN